ncbi:MAG: RNA-directed DNA polymerase [Candidatus Omnitrophica bacterium]|jgi:hypothetical protein|nr:RNA-directed DNA polymerase [Candidatus Omnitrophota bacterium]
MKRVNDLFEKICDYDNLKLALINAQKGKKNYKEVQLVNETPDYFIENLHKLLVNKEFKNSPYFVFLKKDRGKTREIYKLPFFPDRILHHAILQILEPIWKKTLINDTYQSIKGRGIHYGMQRVKKAIQATDAKYCLKLDISKYYPSIANEILKQIIRKKIKCKDTLWLLDEIIDSTKGIPIGNYLSQYFGNLYLTYFDHYVKEVMQIKNYFRYCDDIVMLSNDKTTLWKTFAKIKLYLCDLKLTVKSNYQIFPICKRRLDFLGFKFDNVRVYLRKSIANNFKFKINHLDSIYKNNIAAINSLSSYFGWIKISEAYILWNHNLNKLTT